MSMIYCNVDMFSRKASLIDESGKEFAVIDVDKIGTILPEYCYSTNVDKIHFIGMKNYIDGIVEEIQINNYNNNNLIIEVN